MSLKLIKNILETFYDVLFGWSQVWCFWLLLFVFIWGNSCPPSLESLFAGPQQQGTKTQVEVFTECLSPKGEGETRALSLEPCHCLCNLCGQDTEIGRIAEARTQAFKQGIVWDHSHPKPVLKHQTSVYFYDETFTSLKIVTESFCHAGL